MTTAAEGKAETSWNDFFVCEMCGGDRCPVVCTLWILLEMDWHSLKTEPEPDRTATEKTR